MAKIFAENAKNFSDNDLKTNFQGLKVVLF